ncbi:hypothetical protein NCAS_0B02370 [Naumovozyma castellii]|uniref:F-box domain-containing protein n=1 Tax=Naumovozyma castellii TaxID=27288 RepID=G0VBJ5_NAUCA|nr:hypothetical protein NCAS_0B02370 [Naumovozyma castellii CBS 4309]CCC68321.1 hypothetical protein NCAS_0B02370 [Naumovozyma castellii CBS 4309]
MKFLSFIKNGSKKRSAEESTLDISDERPLKRLSQGSEELKPKDTSFQYGNKKSTTKCNKPQLNLLLKTDDETLQDKNNSSSRISSWGSTQLPTPISTPLKPGNFQVADYHHYDQKYPTIPSSPSSENDQTIIEEFADLNLLHSSQKPHPIFQIPEIVNTILQFIVASEPTTTVSEYERRDVLYQCLQVNKLWCFLCLKYIKDDIKFRKFENVRKFIPYSKNNEGTISPKTLSFYRLNELRQHHINEISSKIITSNLIKLQFYICPNVAPPMHWFPHFTNLQKLIITGNKKLDDTTLIRLASHIPNLITLDLRACVNVSDLGIISIAMHCPHLKLCNLGRHKNKSGITNLSLVALGKYTEVETIGLAGCDISDAGIWEFAKLNGNNLKRLSINNCNKLTDYSIPILIGFNYFPNLAVLEIKNLDLLTDVKWLVRFKLWKKSKNVPVLIDGGERINKLMVGEEKRIRRNNSLLALNDMTQWVNEIDNEK